MHFLRGTSAILILKGDNPKQDKDLVLSLSEANGKSQKMHPHKRTVEAVGIEATLVGILDLQ